MIIYRIRNKQNGKIYIGQTTTSLNRRMSRHLSNPNKNGIDGAIKKYGIENFEIEIIDKAKNIDKLNELEIKWIDSYNCLAPNGYNLHTGGKNHIVSEITRERLRVASTGKKASQKTKKKMSKSGKNKIWTDEHKKNISNAVKGIKHTKEHVSKLPQNQKGYMAGEKHPRALFSNKDIIKIRELLKLGTTNREIAKIYNVHEGRISFIKTGRTYIGIN